MGIGEQLISWYLIFKRDLPWRKEKDPYPIWISEIILQQTRVVQGSPFFKRFMDRFPTLETLAEASIDQVLEVWQGLGYYSRAHNIHETAKYIVDELNGEFPTSFIDLKKLKGIGEYTAAAIASICYEEAVPVIDGNVIRVLARIYGVFSLPIRKQEKDEYWKLAQNLLGANTPSLFNQGIMEFGALLCKPLHPSCEICPLKEDCFAFQKDLIPLLPVKKQKKKLRDRFFNYFVFKEGDFYILQKRDRSDIWPGLFEFPLLETEIEFSWNALMNHKDFPKFILNRTIKEPIRSTQVLSHQRIHAVFWKIDSVLYDSVPSSFVRVEEENLNKYAFSKTTHKLVEEISKKHID